MSPFSAFNDLWWPSLYLLTSACVQASASTHLPRQYQIFVLLFLLPIILFSLSNLSPINHAQAHALTTFQVHGSELAEVNCFRFYLSLHSYLVIRITESEINANNGLKVLSIFPLVGDNFKHGQ